MIKCNEVISLNNTIEQYTKGNINLDLPEIILSDTEIQVSVEAGKSYKGIIKIENTRKHIMKGVVFTSSRQLEVKEKQFVGSEVILHYTINIQNYEVSDTFEGKITILSDCGEVSIPLKATVVAPSIKLLDQTMKNLFQFTDLAKEDWAKAVSVFKEEGFEKILLASEPWRYKELYRNLLKGRSPSGALEEFLIAIHKKQPIHLSLSKKSFTYEAIHETIEDTIIITKDLWGYTEIRVSTDSDFIELDHKILWTDNFIGNQYSLQFKINPEKLNQRKNYGTIYLETALQRLSVEIVCNQKEELKKELIDRRTSKEYSRDLLKNYLDFRLQKIEFQDYISLSKEIIENAQALQKQDYLQLLQCHLYMMQGLRLEAKEIIEQYTNRLAKLKEKDPVIFCAIYYLKALVYQDEAVIQNANEIIRGMYQLGNQDFMIFWFLIYMDKCYVDQNLLLLEDLKKQYDLGCNSPMMYYEVVRVIRDDPACLGELNQFTIKAIHFGMRQGVITEEIVKQYVYLAMKEKYFNRLIFHTLESMYELYPNKEVLTAICTMLIKGHQRAPKYFKWYKLGVESQIRVTQLHEYFMDTVDETSNEPLPQAILLYFIYNSRLTDRKRAYLYARVVKAKAENPSMYRTYSKKIEQFALKQLMLENINENLAVLYEDLLASNRLEEEQYPHLSKIAYRTMVHCKNPNMVGLYVVHKEMENEVYVPLNDQIAYVDVITDDVMFYFVDAKEQRYVASIDYEARRLLKETNQLQQVLYRLNANLYQFVGSLAMEGAYCSYEETSVNLCKQAMELEGLKEEYRNAMVEQLIYYYHAIHNLEGLDEYLRGIRIDLLDKKSRRAIIEICIQRENYEKVIDSISQYGYEDLSATRLSKLCVCLLEADELTISEEMLEGMCIQAFLGGSREEKLIQYLAQSYTGATSMMLQIWQAAMAKHIVVHALEERLLAQVLFSQGKMNDIYEVFLSFYRYAPKVNVSQAFLNYVCAKYLVEDFEPIIEIFGCMKHEVMQRQNRYCAVGLLKYFANHLEEVTEDEQEFVSNLLDEVAVNQVILPEFMKLEEKIAIPNIMRNKVWIQYRSVHKRVVKLYYRIVSKDDDKNAEFTSEIMTPSIYGIYVRNFVLFFNEELEYYFEEESEEGTEKTEIQKVHYEKTNRSYHSSFEQLNEMLTLFEQKENQEELAKLIEQYVKTDYMIKHYFKTI